MSTTVFRIQDSPWFSLGTRRVSGLVALVALIVVAYWPSFQTMAGLWALSSYRHGYIIPIICAYLTWDARERFAAVPWSGSTMGLIALAGSVWIWLIARTTFVQAIEHVAVVLILNAAVLALVGFRAYRTVAFPFTYFVFALPIGTSAVPFLMQLTADVSSAALQIFGIPVYRQGMLLTLPGGAFEVADVCSGFNYLYSGLALAVLVAHVLFRSWPRRVVFVGVAALAFVACNGARAFIVMAVASASDMRWLVGDDHVIFGWAIFFLVMVGLYFFAERYSDRKAHGDRVG